MALLGHFGHRCLLGYPDLAHAVCDYPYFFSEICRIASDREPAAEICSGGSMEAEMKFHARIPGPMSFDWHGSISPEYGLAFLRA